MEHRCGQRTPVNLLVRLTGLADVIGMGRLRNVSASGAFLQTSLELPLLSTVRIELIGRTRHASSYLAGRAYVARKEAGGVGIEWFAPISDSTRMPAANIAVRGRSTHVAHEVSHP